MRRRMLGGIYMDIRRVGRPISSVNWNVLRGCKVDFFPVNNQVNMPWN